MNDKEKLLAYLRGEIDAPDLRWADMRGISINYADLSGLNFAFSDWTGSRVSNCDLSLCNFTSVLIEKASWSDNDMSKSILDNAWIRDTGFSGTRLDGIDLSRIKNTYNTPGLAKTK